MKEKNSNRFFANASESSRIKFAACIFKVKCSSDSQPTKLTQLFLLFIFNFSFFVSYSQSLNRDYWLKQLTDSSFHGRGYVNKGDKLAADFIETQFKKLGALPIKKSYQQYFHHNVNTFPDSMRLTVNGKTLIPGVDYIVDSRSGSSVNKYDSAVNFTLYQFPASEEIQYVLKNEKAIVWDFTVVDSSLSETERGNIRLEAMNIIYELVKKVPVIILNSTKLTWSVSSECFSKPLVYCMKDKFEEADNYSLSFAIQNRMLYKYQSPNVFSMVKAQKKWKKKKYLVYTAHIDHLGRMGEKTFFPGANDNASGTTMLMCLAEYYVKNPPKNYNVAFIGFGGEEAGLLGSEYFVKNPLIPLEKIGFVMNMDIMGTGDEGITVVNATKHTKEFELLEKINAEKNYLVKIKKRGETKNSDHYWFDKNGVKSFFIYTMGGIQAYHDVFDKYETLPLTEYEDLFKMFVEFGDDLMKN